MTDAPDDDSVEAELEELLAEAADAGVDEVVIDEIDVDLDPESTPTTVEELIVALEATTAERDQYLDLAKRTQAEFENHRKRSAKQLDDEVTRKVADLVEQLLPVLDACDGAIIHGSSEVEPIYAALRQTLEKRGLERIEPLGSEFDPNRHEAVLHEPAQEGQDSIIVSDVMRAGYAWQGRVVRPAMVKVQG